MTSYIALILGINIGPNKKMAMPELKRMLEGLGFMQVTTLLATGNVSFLAVELSRENLVQILENAILDTFGFEAGVLVYSREEWAEVVRQCPFTENQYPERTRLYVTFCEDFVSELSMPKFVVKTVGKVIFSVVPPEEASTEFMSSLKKHLRQKHTTRNWNTVQKLAT
jgi:uncharacterized protein (DUF1697 family)